MEKLGRIQAYLIDQRDTGFDWGNYDNALLMVVQCRDDHNPKQEVL